MANGNNKHFERFWNVAVAGIEAGLDNPLDWFILAIHDAGGDSDLRDAIKSDFLKLYNVDEFAFGRMLKKHEDG